MREHTFFYTTDSLKAMILARHEAVRLNNEEIEPEHLMLALLRMPDNYAMRILSDTFHVNLAELKATIDDLLNSNKLSKLSFGQEPIPSAAMIDFLHSCTKLMRDIGQKNLGTEVIVLNLLNNKDSGICRILEELGVTYDAYLTAYNSLPSESKEDFGVAIKIINDTIPPDKFKSGEGSDKEEDFNEEDEDETDEDEEEEVLYHDGESTDKRNKKVSQSPTPFLDKYATDITRLAKKGKLDPVIGRDKEIERVSQILCRRKKNNPILIGAPGVGKSAIVEGLAQMLCKRQVSPLLAHKRLLSLNMASIVAGTKYRGQFEERIQQLLKELKSCSDVILFIDEIHTLIGAGSSPGTMDAANMLKPALARGEVQCIGATTVDEYRKSIEKDGALERRFQKVPVSENDEQETLQILQNLKVHYEEYHHVKYTDKALWQCIKLSGRYITDRSFPDKAIDVMDEAGARTHGKFPEVPAVIKKLEATIQKLENKMSENLKQQNYELFEDYREQLGMAQTELEKKRALWEERATKRMETVDETDIAEVISQMTGIPVSRMNQSEEIRLKGMQQALNGTVIGQQAAVDKVVRSIQRGRMGLKDPNRPIGTFIFLGPTGVGKTLLAKQLATFMFGTPDAIIRIDMSEYMEKFNVSRLVGAPPGYVGYEEGGQLTEQVRRHPYSIVLLDEIEKAHGDVFNLLLQMMDEGRLTDSYGRQVDFRNTVIIMTSNVGSRQLSEFGKGVGFLAKGAQTSAQSDAIIQKALHKQFSPEFLNRLDDVIMFNPLDEASILQIIDLELQKLIQRVSDLGYQLQVNEEARLFLTHKGYDPQMGARPLRRSIQTYLEDELSMLLINESPETGSILVAEKEAAGDKLTLSVTRVADNAPEGTEFVNEMIDKI